MSETFIATRSLPVGSKGHHASGWWGMLALIMTESSLFAYLFFSYFYLASHSLGQWPPNGPPDLAIAAPGTLILIAGSVAMWWGERGIERGKPVRLMTGLVAALLLGLSFIVLELKEWKGQPFMLSTNVYSSLYFTITGFHLLHVVVGMFMLAALLLWASLGYFDASRHSAVSIGGIYWHFVTAVWLAVVFTIYVTPRLS